jgi:hypothetical protein
LDYPVKKFLDSPTGDKDVGLPAAATAAGFAASGWDIEFISFLYSLEADAFHMGIKCWGICGDADGDGDGGRTSPALNGLGGVDFPNYAQSESFLIAFDFGGAAASGPDGRLDFIIGYPAAEAVDSAAFPMPCNRILLDNACFGLYRYSGTSLAQPQYRFRWVEGNAALGATPTTNARDNNPSPTQARPGIEWTILSFNAFRDRAGYPLVSQDVTRGWSFQFLAFSGSFEDDGVGEDFVPASGLLSVEIRCSRFDACDVCGGDGSTCRDCLGNPNGPAVYDGCGVCGGNGSTCRDCLGKLNGPTVYDDCGVCGGDGCGTSQLINTGMLC